MPDSIRSVLEQTFDEVISSSRVETLSLVRTFQKDDPEMVAAIADDVEAELGYRVPDAAREIVNFPVTLELAWKVKGTDDPELIGEFHLENVVNSLTLDRTRVSPPGENAPEEMRPLFEKARYFDAQTTQDWYVATVIIPDETKDFPDLWFMDHEFIYRMNIGIEDYFDALMLTKGMYYWQYLYCSPEAYQAAPEHRQAYVAHLIETLPDVFPDHDYTPLMDRYRAVQG